MEKEIRSLLKLKGKMKKRKPVFKRQEQWIGGQVKPKWRKPKGIRSKMRMAEKARGKVPSPGYGTPAAVRGLTRSGFREVRIFNVADLGKMDPKKDVAVIAAAVGGKKRKEIISESKSKGIRISNA